MSQAPKKIDLSLMTTHPKMTARFESSSLIALDLHILELRTIQLHSKGISMQREHHKQVSRQYMPRPFFTCLH